MATSYTKKPVTIQALQWTGDNADDVRAFGEGKVSVQDQGIPVTCTIPTLEGTLFASVGDYIIKGVKGEFYPCKPDIFRATYGETEPASVLDSGGELPAERDFSNLLLELSTEKDRRKRIELIKEALGVFRAANAEIARLREAARLVEEHCCDGQCGALEAVKNLVRLRAGAGEES